MAERIGMDLTVDIYEPRDFSKPGPAGCNPCGGIIFESLVQLLAWRGSQRLGRDVEAHATCNTCRGVLSANLCVQLCSKVEAVYRALFP